MIEHTFASAHEVFCAAADLLGRPRPPADAIHHDPGARMTASLYRCALTGAPEQGTTHLFLIQYPDGIWGVHATLDYSNTRLQPGAPAALARARRFMDDLTLTDRTLHRWRVHLTTQETA